jgi:hypothetical protein
VQPDARAGGERENLHVLVPTGQVQPRESAQQRQSPAGNQSARCEPGNPSQVGMKVFIRHGSERPYFNNWSRGNQRMRSVMVLRVISDVPQWS